MTQKPSFWESKNSEKYKNFTTSVPSDIPAYEVVYYLLNLKEKTVLDFGCFQGRSSQNLLLRGASRVLGVDNVEEHINVAKRSYLENDSLSFMYVHEKSLIPTKEKFDSVCMTFIHPTINKLDKLKFQVRKIYNVMKSEGILVLLGLHPNSFRNHKFLFYRHKLLDGFGDGVPFANELRLASGETIKFTDCCWTTKTLSRILQENKFSVEGVYSLSEDLEGEIGEVLRKSIKEIGRSWKDEWKAPLYQVMLAKKSS